MWARLGGLAVLVLAVGACSPGGSVVPDEDSSDGGAEEQAVEQLTDFAGMDDPHGIRFTEVCGSRSR